MYTIYPNPIPQEDKDELFISLEELIPNDFR